MHDHHLRLEPALVAAMDAYLEGEVAKRKGVRTRSELLRRCCWQVILAEADSGPRHDALASAKYALERAQEAVLSADHNVALILEGRRRKANHLQLSLVSKTTGDPL